MKIKHNITRTGRTLSGQILDTIFEEGEERGDCKAHYNKDKTFFIVSMDSPELTHNSICLHWENHNMDLNIVSFTYSSEKQAQKALDYINEFTVQEEEKEYIEFHGEPNTAPIFYYVFVPGNGEPKEKHTWLKSAKIEAQRIAKKTGKETFILQAYKSYKVNEIIETNFIHKK